MNGGRYIGFITNPIDPNHLHPNFLSGTSKTRVLLLQDEDHVTGVGVRMLIGHLAEDDLAIGRCNLQPSEAPTKTPWAGDMNQKIPVGFSKDPYYILISWLMK